MDQDRLKAIWAEILQEAKELTSEKKEGEYSLKDFIDMSGMRRSTARDFLENKVQRGELSKRMFRGENLYFPVE